MRKLIVVAIFLSLAATGALAQKRRAPARSAPKKTPVAAAKTIAQISETDWKTLADALAAEDWPKSAALAAAHLTILKTDNEKKQLARLRYIYLYALAGKILAFNAQKNFAEAEKAWTELDRAMEGFIGKEFLLPPRPLAEDCGGRLNYVCPVKDTPRAFRTTATNKEGNAIHSFDYVVFDQPVDVSAHREKETFLGGTLQKADYNEDRTKPWVLRLFFQKGFVRVVD